ncbi:hypothetical protein BF29_3296 [Heyndrickxia coagulans DSM 1 = ATCC 7050]|uniref:Uncharacterized protein n=2 Tax=Heyndrickxia coagulans TaxID=1398 RepID=A0A150K0D2_HEYCO|nr:hypothetical protein BF29_3296 [Heyndrickxia coagulans DSM 1 = ATCC 7050]KYC63020.1 hypothetical protein B4098_0426 [Heyndrickxia coagulans]SHE55836.1 hypothetical protein SAMN02745208_00529 [Heyndrickxia coagulans DSM 1 = ATCC 7050]
MVMRMLIVQKNPGWCSSGISFFVHRWLVNTLIKYNIKKA